MASNVDARQSVLKLRQYLEGNLTDYVGTITTTNTPAIWVEPPFLTEHESINGVAIIISRYQQNFSQKFAGFTYQSFQEFDWQFIIRAYDLSENGLRLYDSALKQISILFSDFRRISLESTENVYPQTRFLLKTHLVTNLQV